MESVIRILFCAALGAGAGWGGISWACRMLQTRGREERFSRQVQRILVSGAAFLGGAVGYYSVGWLAAVLGLALLTVCVAVSVSDWLCRIIPNPTVLSLFALKLLIIIGNLLRIPGLPPTELLSSLGGMVFCFALFFAPGLLGKKVGAGDIKLAAAMGFLLGFHSALVGVVIMGLLVLGYCLVQKNMPLLMFLKTNIPMGPFIAVGMMAAWLLAGTIL